MQIGIVLGHLALVSLAWAFPFWLESPCRRNPNDPNSPANPEANVHITVTNPTPIATMSNTPTPVAGATPTPGFGPGAWVTDFEDNQHNDRTLPPFNVTINTGVRQLRLHPGLQPLDGQQRQLPGQHGQRLSQRPLLRPPHRAP